MVFISTRYLDLGSGYGSSGYATAVTRAYENGGRIKEFPNACLGFQNCPDDGRSKKILSEEDLTLRNVKLVTEHEYEDELTLMMAESGIWFEPDIS